MKWRTLLGFDLDTRQWLLWGQTAQLKIIVHGDVGSQHLQVYVRHYLELTEEVSATESEQQGTSQNSFQYSTVFKWSAGRNAALLLLVVTNGSHAKTGLYPFNMNKMLLHDLCNMCN